MIKIYSDAAFHPEKRDAGLAVVIHNSSTQTNLRKYVHECYDNHQAEFMALDMGLDYLIKNKMTHELVLFYSDSKILVNSFDKKFVKSHDYSQILNKINVKRELFDQIYINWVSEKENRAADQLAKASLRSKK